MQPSLWDQMSTFFLSAFRFPGLDWTLALLAIALGLAFGAIWLIAYRPALPDPLALLAVAVASALLTWTAIAFVQVPLEVWWNQALLQIWGESTTLRWILLAGVPTVLFTGLVQEGAKLVPVVAYRARKPSVFDARTGLIVGAVAGAGFGVFEAIWVHNMTFASGVPSLEDDAFAALFPFVERFFAVGFHVGLTALAGYGLATGRGWQFYLLAAGLHGLGNYELVLAQAGLLRWGPAGLAYIAVLTVGVTAAVLWLRAHRTSARSEVGAAAV
jgi:RsiW-degrading membrane proteinase PrsW (M82 family)